MYKGQNGHTLEWGKKERIDDPGFFSAASFLMECFFSPLMELSFLPHFLILLIDPQSLQRLIVET